jgi:TonB family protein
MAVIVLLLNGIALTQSVPPQQSGNDKPQAAPTRQPAPTTVEPSTEGATQESPRLVIRKFKQPVYPEQARQQQVQGRVWVHLVIDENGKVVSVEPISGDPVLVSAAISAMRDWEFEPYIQNGHSVQVSTKMHYDFESSGNVFDKSGKTGHPATPPEATDPIPTTLDPGVSRGLLIQAVRPVYPKSALKAHQQGTVVLKAIIGKDGLIKDLHVVSSPSDDLAKAALTAVEQWRYRPYLKDGVAVEVDTVINVNFKL